TPESLPLSSSSPPPLLTPSPADRVLPLLQATAPAASATNNNAFFIIESSVGTAAPSRLGAALEHGACRPPDHGNLRIFAPCNRIETLLMLRNNARRERSLAHWWDRPPICRQSRLW